MQRRNLLYLSQRTLLPPLRRVHQLWPHLPRLDRRLAPSLSRREVTFTVKVPENTRPGDTVYVNVLPFLDWSWEEEQHVPLTLTAEGLWSGKVFVEGGALARYVYDRWDETEWEDFKETREASGESIEIESRWLLAEPGLEEVNDVVETWNDPRAPASVGTITGMVVDIANGAPLMDASVSVGGIHTAFGLRRQIQGRGHRGRDSKDHSVPKPRRLQAGGHRR